MQHIFSSVGALVVDTCGRISNTIGMANIAGLQLEQLRFVAMLDQGANASSIRRENQVCMAKPPATQWAELPWNVATLLLARGVDYMVANHGPTSPEQNDAVGRLVVSALEHSTIRALGETLSANLRHQPDAKAEASSDLFGLWKSSPSDSANVFVYGTCCDDTLPPAGSSKK